MSLHRIHSSRDGFSPRAQLTPWQRERRDGPLGSMVEIANRSPESFWQALFNWVAVISAMALLFAVLA